MKGWSLWMLCKVVVGYQGWYFTISLDNEIGDSGGKLEERKYWDLESRGIFSFFWNLRRTRDLFCDPLTNIFVRVW